MLRICGIMCRRRKMNNMIQSKEKRQMAKTNAQNSKYNNQYK